MNIPDGTLLQGGKYRIVRHISSGGFGNTYEALDVNLDKRVAIKEFFVKDFCSRESDTTLVTIASTAKKPLIEHLKKKFIEEARAIAKMEHDNIVKVQALFEENSTAYYVMDYIDGESLSTLLKRRGSLPEKEAVDIILRVADALDYMHKQNRFHLDVKPANIMIRKDGKVILIDFGSSKQYAEVDGENTTTLAPCYTTGYAPSEQMNPRPTAFTAATDVYALGATLYKMLTGQTPLSAIDLLNGEEVLSPLPDDISKNVHECVEKAMIPQRSKRTQSIEEFVTLLKVGNTASPIIDNNSKTLRPRWKVLLCLLLSVVSCTFVWLLTIYHSRDLYYYKCLENDMGVFRVPAEYIEFTIFSMISATLLFFMILYTGINIHVRKSNWVMLLCSACTIVYCFILLVIQKKSSDISMYGEPMFSNIIFLLWIVCTQLYWWTSIKKGLFLPPKAFLALGFTLSLLQLLGFIMFIILFFSIM